MTFYIVSLIVIILNFTTCLAIMADIKYDKYCPKNNTCDPPESHLVCKFFENVKDTNLLCINHELYTLTKRDTERLLDQINKVRAKVATGKEKGKNGQRFPRAFGMFRLNWDSELAAISDFFIRNADSQSWHTCAATRKFVKPIVSASVQTITVGGDLTESFVISWEEGKKSTAAQDIWTCPDLTTHPGRSYIKMIQGAATHVGCSLATCEKSSTNKEKVRRLLCYYSYWTPVSVQLYTTTPPRPGTNVTSKCGCPPGYWEDTGCLCQEIGFLTTSTAIYYHPTRIRSKDLTAHYGKGVYDKEPMEIRQWWATPQILRAADRQTSKNPISTRKPKIVFLPVFAVTRSNRNAIPHRRRFNNMRSTSHTKSIHVINFFKDYEIEKAYKKSSIKTSIASETEFHNTKLGFRTPDLTTKIFNENIFGHQRPSRRNNYADYYGNIIKENLKDDNHRSTMSALDIFVEKKRHVKHSSYEINFFSDNMKTTRKDVLNNRQNENIQFANSDSAVIPSDIEKDFEELKNYLTHKTNNVHCDEDNATHCQQHETDKIFQGM